jgi:hypothetical protein
MQSLLQWKEVNISYSECVSVVLRTQHAMRMRHIVTYDLPCTKIFNLTLFVSMCSIFHTKYIYFQSKTSVYYY